MRKRLLIIIIMVPQEQTARALGAQRKGSPKVTQVENCRVTRAGPCLGRSLSTDRVSSCRMAWCALRRLRCPRACASEGTPGSRGQRARDTQTLLKQEAKSKHSRNLEGALGSQPGHLFPKPDGPAATSSRDPIRSAHLWRPTGSATLRNHTRCSPV